eukprot:5454386-Heterocapsa_arctica.AAC.1
MDVTKEAAKAAGPRCSRSSTKWSVSSLISKSSFCPGAFVVPRSWQSVSCRSSKVFSMKIWP